MRNQLLIFFIFSILLASCYDDSDDSTTITIPDEPELFVDANLIGEVKDLDDKRIQTYIIRVNGFQYLPLNGKINLELDYVSELSQSIYIETGDGRDAFVNTTLIRNDINYSEIILFPALKTENVIVDQDITLDLNEEITLNLNKDQFVNHSQPGQLSILHRNLSDEKLVNQLGHRGFNKFNEESVIDIYKAFHFSFGNPKTENVDLKPGESLSLNISGISNPNQKALFRYSEENEYWIWIADIESENQEFLIDNDGYYTIADHLPAIVAQSRLTIDMKPVVFQPLTLSNNEIETNTRTTASGRWMALIPKTDLIDVTIINPCGLSIGTYELQSDDVDTKFNDEDISDVQSSFLNLDTQILDCNGMVEAMGSVTIGETSNTSTYVFQDENLDLWIPVCGNEISISALNTETGESGPAIDWNNSIDDEITYLSNCEQYQNGFSIIKINGYEKTFLPFEIKFNGIRTILESPDSEFKLSFDGNQKGMYSENAVHISINDNQFGDKGYFISCENSDEGCGINQCQVTHYAENDGDWTRVSFAGRLWMQTIDPPVAAYHDIEGLIIARK